MYTKPHKKKIFTVKNLKEFGHDEKAGHLAFIGTSCINQEIWQH